MNKTDIIEEVAARTGLPKRKIGIVINQAFDVIKDEVAAGKKVTINTFGSFFLKQLKGKTIKLAIGGVHDMPAGEVPKFKAAPGFKERV
jgi:DNA-binding protein HU-beta